MEERLDVDPRSANQASYLHPDGSLEPMSIKGLQKTVAEWDRSAVVPEEIERILDLSRRLFVVGYFVYENFTYAAYESVRAVIRAIRTLVPSINLEHEDDFRYIVDEAYEVKLIDKETKDTLMLAWRLVGLRKDDPDHVVSAAIARGFIARSHTIIGDIYSPGSSYPPANPS